MIPTCGKSAGPIPRHIRAAAYQYWAWRCGGQWPCVESELQTHAQRDGWRCVPAARTLRDWHGRDDWPLQRAIDLRRIAPDLMGGMVADVLTAASDATRYVAGVVKGEIEPKGARLRASLAVIAGVGVLESARSEALIALRDLQPGAIPSHAAHTPASLGASDSDGVPQSLPDMAAIRDAVMLRVSHATSSNGQIGDDPDTA